MLRSCIPLPGDLITYRDLQFCVKTYARIRNTFHNVFTSYLILDRDFGQMQFTADDKAAKEFGRFVVCLSTSLSRHLLKYMSLFQSQFDSEVSKSNFTEPN
jgi:hypothetical protein